MEKTTALCTLILRALISSQLSSLKSAFESCTWAMLPAGHFLQCGLLSVILHTLLVACSSRKAQASLFIVRDNPKTVTTTRLRLGSCRDVCRVWHAVNPGVNENATKPGQVPQHPPTPALVDNAVRNLFCCFCFAGNNSLALHTGQPFAAHFQLSRV